jgi:hypothetical protein
MAKMISRIRIVTNAPQLGQFVELDERILEQALHIRATGLDLAGQANGSESLV